jgi:hypothetical protein
MKENKKHIYEEEDFINFLTMLKKFFFLMFLDFKKKLQIFFNFGKFSTKFSSLVLVTLLCNFPFPLSTARAQAAH